MDNAEKFLSNIESQVLRTHQTIESAMLLVSQQILLCGFYRFQSH